jgi:hypothetical protein
MFGTERTLMTVQCNSTDMLNDFLIANRDVLISRCKNMVAKRFAPAKMPIAVENGVPQFMVQLIDALDLEHRSVANDANEAKLDQRRAEIATTAAFHGAELLRVGYTIDQVVRDYGDLCQTVTAMALEQNVSISVDEFRTFNRCLDDAIAGAVTSFGQARQDLTDERANNLRVRLNSFADEYRRLVNIANHSFSAIKTGTVGPAGATGELLTHTLDELRALSERTLPQLHLLSEATTVSAR